MRAEFTRAGAPEQPAGAAVWDGRAAVLDATEPGSREVLERVFRLTPVVVDDPAVRSTGAEGPAVISPGTLDWFRYAALSRGAAEGLTVRLSQDHPPRWDPAGDYHPLSGPSRTGTSRA